MSWQTWRTVWWAGIAYGGLTVVMTWPMATGLSSPYAKPEFDFGLWLWDLWWMKKALVDLGSSPYFTSYLYHPTGTSLVFHNLSPYNGLVGIPLQLLGADVIMTHNLLYLSSFVIGGVGMFLLVRELTGSLFGGFVAGAVYAFSPARTLSYAETNLWAIQWLPVALLFAVRLLRVGRLQDDIGLAIALMLATLCDWHQPLLLVLTIIVLTVSSAFSWNQAGCVRTGALQRLLWSLLLYGLLVFPLAVLVLRELVVAETLIRTPTPFQAELVGYRGPDGDVISWGVLYGWISMALVVYGIARGLDFWTKCFAGLLAMFFVLSLGEGLRLPGFTEPVLPLPFLLWRKLPFLGIMRTSIYFWIMVQVCVAVLAGHGAKRLWERMADWQPGLFARLRPALAGGLLAPMLVEVFQPTLTPVAVSIHPVYEAIRREGQRGAVLDAPIGYTRESSPRHAGWSMYLQTLHGRPLVGGYTQFDGRKRLTFLAQNPVLNLFMERWTPRAKDIPDGVEEEELRSFLAEQHVSWIILRKGVRDPKCDQRRVPGWTVQKLIILVAPAVVNEGLGAGWPYCGDWEIPKADTLVRRTVGPPVWDDAELIAYRVP